MTRSSMDQLSEELLQQTREGKVAWEEVEGGQDAYRVAFADITLIVSKWAPLRHSSWQPLRDFSNSFNLDIATYRLELRNDAGEVEESLAAIPGQAAYRVLREVFALAHHQASHTERNIDKAIEYLRGTSA